MLPTKREELIDMIEERTRFYINSPEKGAEALLFVKRLTEITERLNEKVRERASQVMDFKDLEKMVYAITDDKTGEIREWEISRTYDTISCEYSVSTVVKELGLEDCIEKGLLKVNKTKADKYAIKKNVPLEVLKKDAKETIRKTSGIKIREIIEKA